VRVLHSSQLADEVCNSYDILQIIGEFDIHQLRRSGAGEAWAVIPVVSGAEQRLRLAVEMLMRIRQDMSIRPHFDTASSIGGGTGTRFDLSTLLEVVDEQIIEESIVAGGLTPENVSDLLKYCSPYAVDVASGIEAKGVPNDALMNEFVLAVNRGHRLRPTRMDQS
jgi:phosphoribosylanthranilate isomerase